MCQNITVKDVLAFVKKAIEREVKTYYAFSVEVAGLFQATTAVIYDMPDTTIPLESFSRGPSRPQHRRRARYVNKSMSSVKSLGSIISQNSKISPKNAGFLSDIKEVIVLEFNLNIKELFIADVFKIEKRENNNFYIVREKKSCPPAAILKKYIGKNEMLQMERLNKDIMKELEGLLEGFKLPVTITRTDKAVCVDLEYTSLLEIEPHVPVSSMIWKDCPDLVAIGEIPQLVQKTIREIREAEDLAIFVPLSSKVLPSRYEHAIKMFFYDRVELEFFMKNESFTEMIKLVNIAYYHFSWLGVGMSGEWIRRIALREADTLCFKTKWEGYSYILKSIKEELVKTTFMPDFFIFKPHLGIEDEVISPFLKSIDDALKLLPEDLLDMAKSIQYYSCIEDVAYFDLDYYKDDDNDDYDYGDEDCDFEI